MTCGSEAFVATLLVEPCRLFSSLWSRINQLLGSLPTIRARELSLERRETG